MKSQQRQAHSNAKSASARSDVHRPPEPKLDIGTAKEHLKLESGRHHHDPQSAVLQTWGSSLLRSVPTLELFFIHVNARGVLYSRPVERSP